VIDVEKLWRIKLRALFLWNTLYLFIHSRTVSQCSGHNHSYARMLTRRKSIPVKRHINLACNYNPMNTKICPDYL